MLYFLCVTNQEYRQEQREQQPPQGAGYGAVTDRAAVLKSVVSKPPFGVRFRLGRVNSQPPSNGFFICRFRWRLGTFIKH